MISLLQIFTLLTSLGLVERPLDSYHQANQKYLGGIEPFTELSDVKFLTKARIEQSLVKFKHDKMPGAKINIDMVLPLGFVMAELEIRGLSKQITDFGGCYNPRHVRGKPGKPSTHLYGLACDFNFQSGQKFSEEFIQVWEMYGFTSGHTFNDLGHFSYGWE